MKSVSTYDFETLLSGIKELLSQDDTVGEDDQKSLIDGIGVIESILKEMAWELLP